MYVQSFSSRFSLVSKILAISFLESSSKNNGQSRDGATSLPNNHVIYQETLQSCNRNPWQFCNLYWSEVNINKGYHDGEIRTSLTFISALIKEAFYIMPSDDSISLCF